jgi:hypothetical protein
MSTIHRSLGGNLYLGVLHVQLAVLSPSRRFATSGLLLDHGPPGNNVSWRPFASTSRLDYAF